MAKAAIESQGLGHYCHVCNRNFVDDNALRMHLTNSTNHKEKAKRQISSRTLSLHSSAAARDPLASEYGNHLTLTVPKAEATIKPKGVVLYCDICESEFVNENGMRMHFATSKDHKKRVKMQKLSTQAQNLEPPALGIVSYCDVCEREFIDENEMQLHLATSKEHKERGNMQELFTQAQDLKSIALQAPSTFASTILYGHLAHTQNTFAAPTYGYTGFVGYTLMHPATVEKSSHGQAGNATTFPSNNLTELRSQTQKRGAFPQISTPLPQPNQIPNQIGSAQDNSSRQNVDLMHKNFVPAEIPSFQQSLELESLSEQCHTSEHLSEHKYLLCPYTTGDIAGLCRCQNCRGLRKNLQARVQITCTFHPKKRQTQKDGQRFYPCCGEVGSGCVSFPAHVYGNPDRISEARFREFAPTPAGSSQLAKRRAVTLDCEMAAVGGGMNVVILLCAADYLTGETLINSLVSPTEKVVDWRTKYSGVTRSAMAMAEAQCQTLKGWQGARYELWRYIDADTVLVGHALQHDLDVLRIIHTNVVDSAILTKNALGPESRRRWGLKTLCYEFLGIEIQNKGRKGHDCWEDALAAREVVLWCCRHPQELRNWGKVKREEEEKKLEMRKKDQEKRKVEKEKEEEEGGKEKKKQKEKKEKNKEKQEKQKEKNPRFTSSRPKKDAWLSDEDGEVLHWSDIAEDLGWPHPDTGYDPWSD